MDYQNFKNELYATVLCKEETVEKYAKMTDKEEAERLRVQYFLERYPAILRPLNYKRNQAELKEGIYWRFGDISLVLYAPLFDGGDDDVMMQVDREVIRKWHVEEQMLLEEALQVTSRRRPLRLYRSTDMEILPEEGARGYRLTAVGYINGAVAFFYPGVRERIAELMGGDYYVGFINVHEALVQPVRYKVLQEMKAAILRTSILGDGREVLTEKVYRYCCHQARLVEV